MVKKLLSLSLGLVLTAHLAAQAPISESEVTFWAGTGSNSTLVAIGWDDTSEPYTPTVVVWGVHWDGNITLLDALDSIATYDNHFSYSFSGSFLGSVSYVNSDAGLNLTPSGYNCNSYGGAYGTTSLDTRWLRITTSTCSNYDFYGVNNVYYPVDPAAASSCPRPVSVSASNIGQNSAEITIVDTTHRNDYTVLLYSGNVVIDSLHATDTTVSYTSLLTNTAYTVSVSTNCADGTHTLPMTHAFRTLCNPMVYHTELPWGEDFNSYSGAVAPQPDAAFTRNIFCWTVPNAPSYTNLYINNSSTINAAGGRSLYVSGSSTVHPFIVLPAFEDAPSDLMLTFDVRPNYLGAGFTVGIIDDPTDTTTFHPINTCIPQATGGWEHFEATFAGHTSGHIAFRLATNSAAYLDNILVQSLPSCVKPSMLTLQDLSSTSATILVSDPNEVGSYQLTLSSGDTLSFNGSSYPLSGLQPNRLYRVGVSTVCADSVTGETSLMFRTLCAAAEEIPFHEDFDAYTDLANDYSNPVRGGQLPCWEYIKEGDGGYISLFTRSQGQSYAYRPTGYTLKLVPSSNTSHDMLILPQTAEEISTLELTFATRVYSLSAGTLEIGYVTDAADTSTFVSTAVHNASEYYANFISEAATFAGAPAGARIALRQNSASTSGYWYFDEIDIHSAPACSRIEAASASEIGTRSFSLHIADPSETGNYFCILDSEGQTDTVYFTDTVYTVENLSPATEYTVSAGSICTDGTMTLARTFSVVTLCAPISELPFVEGFEDWPTGQTTGMIRCWNRTNSNNGTISHISYPYANSGASTAYEGTKSLRFASRYSSASSNQYSVIYLPEFEEDINHLQLVFRHYAGNTYFNRLRVVVGVCSSTADTSTLTRVATITPRSNSWEEYEVDFSGYTGTGTHIVIMQSSTTSTNITSYVDNIVVDSVRTCNRPNAVWADSVGSQMAVVSWSDVNSSEGYRLRITDGTMADTIEALTDTTYTFNELRSNTNYTVEVSSICYGEPTLARTFSFKTACAEEETPWSEDFSRISQLSDLFPCWKIYNGLYNDTPTGASLSEVTSGWVRTTTGLDGSAHMKLNIYGSSVRRRLVTPPVMVNEDCTLKFNFALTKYNTTNPPDTESGFDDDRFVVLATTDEGATWTSLAKWGSQVGTRDDYEMSSISHEMDSAELSLSTFVGQTVRIAFYGESSTSGADNDLHIDNIRIQPAPAAPQEEPLQLCTTVQTLPYEEDFSGYTLGTNGRPFVAAAPMPDCWTVVGNGRFTADYDTAATASIYFSGIGTATSINNYGCITPSDPFFSFMAYGHYDGTYATYIANERNYGTAKLAVLPPFDHSLSEVRLSFDHRSSARSGAILKVGYVQQTASSFVAIDSFAADYRVLHHDTIDFRADSLNLPADARLALLWTTTDTIHTGDAPANYFCGIDNLRVEVPADTVQDTIPTPQPNPVDAGIDFEDIVYWVGTGSNSAAFIVNYAAPDTAFAWGYHFSGATTIQDMVDDIAAADPRLTIVGNPSYMGDIRFALSTGDTLGLSPVDSTLGYNFWWTNLNGVSVASLSTVLADGDIFKYGDLNSATGWDMMYGYYMQEAWEKTPTPVSEPVIHYEPGHGPFCGPVGTAGCDAIAADSSAIQGWATTCVVTRGPQLISTPNSPLVTYGTDSLGAGPASLTNNLNVVSLGDGGSALLTFQNPIANGEGPDFAVYENSFDDYFLELAFVEVSSDGQHFVRFPATSHTQTETQIGGTGRVDATMINNLAGKYRSGYGTPFDLSDLADSTGIDLSHITHVRIVDVVGSIDPQYGTYDAFGHLVNDPFPTNSYSGGFDLAGVAVLHYATLGIEESAAAEVSIYPNPATTQLHISGAEGSSAMLFDAAGRKLMQREHLGSRETIDISSLPAGVYILRIGNEVHKVVKSGM